MAAPLPEEGNLFLTRPAQTLQGMPDTIGGTIQGIVAPGFILGLNGNPIGKTHLRSIQLYRKSLSIIIIVINYI